MQMTEQASRVERKYAKQDEWNARNTIRMTMRFTLNSGIPQALKKVCEQTGISETQYVRNAVIQALQWDGFNPEDFKPVHRK